MNASGVAYFAAYLLVFGGFTCCGFVVLHVLVLGFGVTGFVFAGYLCFAVVSFDWLWFWFEFCLLFRFGCVFCVCLLVCYVAGLLVVDFGLVVVSFACSLV